MPRIARVFFCLSLILVATLLPLLMNATAGAEDLDLSRVYRGGKVEDGVLVADRVSVLFEIGAEPTVLNKGADFSTDQALWNTLSKSFDVSELQVIFPGTAMASKWTSPEEAELARWYTVSFDGDRHDLADIVGALESMAGVEQVAPIPLYVESAVVPNDPFFADQVHLHNTNPSGRDIRAMAAWYYTTGGSNIVVAVGDSGVDWQHPDLGGTGPDFIDGSIWINQDEWNGTPLFDDDGNGYIDDYRGWDFVTGVTGEQNPPQDVQTPDNDPMDYGGHGTAVSGCVAAIGNNSIGVVGTAFTSKIMALRVGYLPPGEPLGTIRADWSASALNYARIKGAKVFNASWGGGSTYPPLLSAITVAVNSGMTFVKAAGNDDDELADSVSNHTGVLNVAATNSTDGKASFSTYGTWIDVSAPGVAIYTTKYNRFGSGNTLHTYGTISGTSFSAPITAGMAAIIYTNNPGITSAAVKAAIIAATDPIDEVNPPIYAGKLGSGRINLLKLYDDTRIEIPEQMPDISGAVATLALVPGAEIAVLGGHTVVDAWLLVHDGDLQILGGWDASYTTRDPIGNPSILQAEGGRPALRVRVGVGPGTVIDGFRITGGVAEQVSLAPVTGFYGGGARIEDSDLTLRNLIFESNRAGNATDMGGGGGIAILNCSPSLENVEITGNTGYRGAGLYIFNGSPQIDGLNVHDNISHPGGTNQPPDGGGVYIVDSPSTTVPGTVTISNATISGHTVAGQGGGIFISNSALVLDQVEISGNTASEGGGGLHADNTPVTATNLEVLNNTVDGANKNGGGLELLDSSLDLDGGIISGNSAVLIGGGFVVTGGASVQIRSVFVTGNSTTIIGSGGSLSGVPSFLLENNTVADNDGASFGANGLYLTSSTGTLANNIFAFNGGVGSGNADGVSCGGGSITFDCNLFYANTLGHVDGCDDPIGSSGNVDADPLFCSSLTSDFSISPISPAAAAQSGGCGTIGADAETCIGTAVDDPTPGRTSAFLVHQNVPNPFNPITRISFAIPVDGRVQVTVFDARGRRVATLLDRELPAGEHNVRWDGRDAAGARVSSGIYLYEVRSGNHRSVKKMGLIK